MVRDYKRGHRVWWWVLPAAAALALVAAAVLVALGGRTPSASAATPCTLTITKTADASKVPEDGNIKYTLAVKNTSPDTACANVVITDAIVADLDCTSTTEPAGFIQAGCSGAAGAVVTWTAATLAFNTTATLTMDVTLGSGADDGETIANTATGVADGPITATPGTVSVEVDDCDLTIDKSDDPNRVGLEGEITYTITVTNEGDADCTETITVSDDNPTHTDCVESTVDSSSDIDESDFTISDCNYWKTTETLDSGADIVLTMVVELTSSADDGDKIDNEACVNMSGFAEKCAQETTTVDEDVTTATKTPTPGPTATPGGLTPTATPRPAVPVIAPAPPAPSAGLAPTLTAPITGSGAESGAGGSQPLALALGLAGGCLLLLGGVAMLKRPR
jgi:uncharacterized repeat protein (TIGR01451 family)